MKNTLVMTVGLALGAFGATAVQARQVCHNVRVKHIQSQDNHRLIGTGVGAVAGGLLGHQVGGGKGKTLATVGGAVAGGVVGNQVQKNAQNKKAYYTTERRCEEVND
ncbi:glycine zipper 2TM domain-containing protein [Rhodanobacter sp. BL-MT-08]